MSRGLGRRLLALALVAAAVAALVVALPGLGEVRRAFAGVKVGWLSLVALLELASCVAYVVVFRPIFCRHMPWQLGARIGFAEQAADVLLPTGGTGGLALGAWALRRAGMSAEHIARRSVSFFVLTSAVNFVTAALVGLALATGVLRTELSLQWTLGPAAAAVLVICAAVALARTLPHQTASPSPAAVRQRRARRLASYGRQALGDGLRDAAALLRTGRPSIFLGAVGYMAFDAAALWAAFEALGGAPNGATFMLAYVLGQLAGLIPVPGGLGVTEGGLVGVLVLYGTPVAGATAAVLGYRLFQLSIPAGLGALSLVSLQHHPGAVSAPSD